MHCYEKSNSRFYPPYRREEIISSRSSVAVPNFSILAFKPATQTNHLKKTAIFPLSMRKEEIGFSTD